MFSLYVNAIYVHGIHSI